MHAFLLANTFRVSSYELHEKKKRYSGQHFHKDAILKFAVMIASLAFTMKSTIPVLSQGLARAGNQLQNALG